MRLQVELQFWNSEPGKWNTLCAWVLSFSLSLSLAHWEHKLQSAYTKTKRLPPLVRLIRGVAAQWQYKYIVNGSPKFCRPAHLWSALAWPAGHLKEEEESRMLLFDKCHWRCSHNQPENQYRTWDSGCVPNLFQKRIIIWNPMKQFNNLISFLTLWI